jgi:hypothetical protein
MPGHGFAAPPGTRWSEGLCSGDWFLYHEDHIVALLQPHTPFPGQPHPFSVYTPDGRVFTFEDAAGVERRLADETARVTMNEILS